ARPALDLLQAQARRSIAVEEIVQHGEPPPSPDVSVIVPLYGRTDLVEHQIAQFWNDPDMAAAELIYVLDSPELGNQLAHEAAARSGRGCSSRTSRSSTPGCTSTSSTARTCGRTSTTSRASAARSRRRR